MKKYFLTAAALLLLSPLTASADLVGTGTMSIAGSGNTVTVSFTDPYNLTFNGALLDYNVTSSSLSPDIGNYTQLSLDSFEVYCIEGSWLQSPASFKFYTGSEIYSTNWAEVTWLANKGLNAAYKEESQKALWELIAFGNVDGSNYVYSNSTLKTEFDNLTVTDKNKYINQWSVAIAPNVDTTKYAQDFLVKATFTPVPEPGTMLLFGTGLAGLAAVSRRRRS